MKSFFDAVVTSKIGRYPPSLTPYISHSCRSYRIILLPMSIFRILVKICYTFSFYAFSILAVPSLLTSTPHLPSPLDTP